MAYADVIAADAPIRYWRFEEASGAYHTTIGTDSATVIGTPSRPTPGMAGSSRAVGFPTISDYVQLGTKGTIPSAAKRASFSWECWFKTVGGPFAAAGSGQACWQILGTDCFVDAWSNLSWSLLMLRTNSSLPGQVEATVRMGGAGAACWWGTRLDDNNWHHAVVTYDGANLRMYVDGVVRDTVPRTGAVNAGFYDPMIGYNPYYNATYPDNIFPGIVDEVAIYETVLTPAQILAHYNAGIVPANDLWVWNGTAEVPANVTVWNGTAEIASSVTVT